MNYFFNLSYSVVFAINVGFAVANDNALNAMIAAFMLMLGILFLDDE